MRTGNLHITHKTKSEAYLRVACRCGDPFRNDNTEKVRPNASNREPIRIVQQNNYDAWGLDFGNPTVSPSGVENNRFQYNSKERIQDLGIEMYDYGARHYDPNVGRWSAIDQLTENYFALSPYSFVANNTLNNLEVDGKEFIIVFIDNEGVSHEYSIENGTDVAEEHKKVYDAFKTMIDYLSTSKNETSKKYSLCLALLKKMVVL
jgi:RHS repeat-associated protein